MRYFSTYELDLLLTQYFTLIPLLSMRLFKSGTTIVPGMTLADLVAIECDFSGYSPIDMATAVLTGPYPKGVGGVGVLNQPGYFQADAVLTVPNTVGGYWFAKTLMPFDLVEYGEFDAPIVVTNPLQVIIPSIELILGPAVA